MRLLKIPCLLITSTLALCAATSSPQLELVWETEPSFSFPECVVYDPQRQVLYVSNIGETPKDVAHNGDGYITELTLDGKILNERLVEGLNDPKGMDIHHNTLWINDRDAVVEWDLATQSLIKRHELSDVVFLNDIGVGPAGEVFTNDADGHKILNYEDGQWQVFWQSDAQPRPNGILVEPTRLLITMNWSHQLVAIDRATKAETLLLDEIGAGDGIEPTGNGGYLITDYLGQLFYLDPQGSGSVLMDSRDHKLTADLEYIQDQSLIIIPRHKNHTVAAYRIAWE